MNKVSHFISIGVQLGVSVMSVFLGAGVKVKKTVYITNPIPESAVVIFPPIEERRGFMLTAVSTTARIAGMVVSIPAIQWEIKAYPGWM